MSALIQRAQAFVHECLGAQGQRFSSDARLVGSREQLRRAVHLSVDSGEMGVMAATKSNSRETTAKRNKDQQPAGEMDAELQRVAEVIRELLITSDPEEAQAKYRVGRQVLDVMNASDKYGKRGVERLAEKLGRGKDSLYDCASVAETWSEEEFAALLKRKSTKGLPLSFAHLVKLSQVESKEEQAALISEVLSKGLSVREMCQLANPRQPTSGRQIRTTRKQSPPVSHHHVLARLEELSAQLSDEEPGLEKALSEFVDGGETQGRETLLRRLIELQEKVIARCTYRIDRFKSALERIRDDLAAEANRDSSVQDHARIDEHDLSITGAEADFRNVPKIDDLATAQIEGSVMAHSQA